MTVLRIVCLCVPPIAAAVLGALAAVLPRSFEISFYWVVVAAVRVSKTIFLFVAAKSRD